MTLAGLHYISRCIIIIVYHYGYVVVHKYPGRCLEVFVVSSRSINAIHHGFTDNMVKGQEYAMFGRAWDRNTMR
jgi:hypothetical protein